MIRARISSFLLLQAAVLIYSMTSLLAKKAAEYDLLSGHFLLFYSMELSVFGLYALLWQQILKRIDLSKAYTARGGVVIWNLLWAAFIFGEKITLNNLAGGVMVLLGIGLVFKNNE